MLPSGIRDRRASVDTDLTATCTAPRRASYIVTPGVKSCAGAAGGGPRPELRAGFT